jgi:hypothetical protein
MVVVFQYQETRVADTIDPRAPQEPLEVGGESCSTLNRLREMGVSFVNREDLMASSKWLVAFFLFER